MLTQKLATVYSYFYFLFNLNLEAAPTSDILRIVIFEIIHSIVACMIVDLIYINIALCRFQLFLYHVI